MDNLILKKEKRLKLIVSCINSIRNSLLIEFSYNEFTNRLKDTGCPYAKEIFTILKYNDQIQKRSGNKYSFINSNPIYYKSIEKNIDDLIASKRIKKSEVLNSSSEEITKAINLLKNNGYKIQKQVVTYVEC